MLTAPRLLTAAALLLLPVPALAQEDYVPDCKNPQTQNDFNICAFEDAEKADKALNVQYKRTIASLEENDFTDVIERLRKAQRLWIDFRDAHCATESALMEGGSALPQVLHGCRAEVTRTRTKQLKTMTENF